MDAAAGAGADVVVCDEDAVGEDAADVAADVDVAMAVAGSSACFSSTSSTDDDAAWM